MESKQTSEDFNFQYYVDMAKQKKIDWHVFVKLIQDFSYSDISRLKYVNAILLTKLTDSYSDMDRLKYLNVILMNRFKDLIQIEFNVEVISENDNFEVVKILNDETIKERSSDSEIQILGISVNERHKPKKIRKKRTIYKPVEEPKRVKILKYVLSNKKSLYPEGQKSGGRLTNAAMQAWDKVYELCIR